MVGTWIPCPDGQDGSWCQKPKHSSMLREQCDGKINPPPRSQWTVHTRDLHSQPIGINCINEKWCNWAQPSKVARAERSRMTGVTVMKPSPGQPDEPCDARPRSQISICKCTFTQRHTQHACIYVCVFRHVTYPHNRHDRCRKNRQSNYVTRSCGQTQTKEAPKYPLPTDMHGNPKSHHPCAPISFRKQGMEQPLCNCLSYPLLPPSQHRKKRTKNRFRPIHSA